MSVEEKEIELFYPNTKEKELPVVILHTYGKEGKKVWEECQKLKTKDFILVGISNIDWNNEMTPWREENIIKNDPDFAGKADNYLLILDEKILPRISKEIHKKYKVSYYALVGYSLGGLFALYATYTTNTFQRVASVSGSLWYPGFLDYVKEHKINTTLDKAYFSLGNKEKNSKNTQLQKVEDMTKKIESIYAKATISIYKENEGNHFQEAELRIAKAIQWILQ